MALCAGKDRERAALLLRRGADPNAANKAGSAPLHLVTDVEIAQVLLEGGANPNLPDGKGNSPLHCAVRRRNKDVVRLILACGGDPKLAGQHNKTPVQLAKDKEMRHILCGKDCDQTNGVAASPVPPAGTPASSSSSARKAANSSLPLSATVFPDCSSPGILKRRRRYSDSDTAFVPTEDVRGAPGSPPPAKRCRGPRLRFSEVNDYSGVEELHPYETTLSGRRVKAMPIYNEPAFSSDDE